VDRRLRERRRRERGGAEDAAVREQPLHRAPELDVEHPHDEVHGGVALLREEGRADVCHVVLLEQRERPGIVDPCKFQRRSAPEVAGHRSHAAFASVQREMVVVVADHRDDVLAERHELVEHPHGEPVGAAEHGLRSAWHRRTLACRA